MLHSYLVPGLEYGNTIRSNLTNPAVNSGWNSTSYFAGNTSLLEAWGHSVLGINYSGGGYLSSDGRQGNGQFHQLAAGYTLNLRRWQLLFLDQFSYLPESGFGFGSTTALGIPGVGGTLGAPLPTLQGGFTPNQSVLSATGPRYSNTSGAQLTYLIGKRSSITVGGTFGLLRFVNSTAFDNYNPSLNAGYSYEITKNDSIGLLYRFGAFHFTANPQAIGDHTAQLAYGRKITGRLALQLYGGPEYTAVRVPVGGQTSRLVGSGGATLVYGSRRNLLTLSYMNGVTGGSGVLTGAASNTVTATLGRELTRTWQGGLDFGFARNGTLLNGTGQPSQHYNSWYAGGGLTRPFGRETTLSLGYRAEIEQASQSVCNVPGCGAYYLQHSIWISMQWHSSPLVLQ
jgi:hypothetical protein